MMEDQLPMLVKFTADPAVETMAHAVLMEEMMMVPTDYALVDNCFATATATYLLPQVTMARGGVEMNLSNFCPLPPAGLAWAPSFLDCKSPQQEALERWRDCW
jgi:hypothetical protein